MACDHYQIYQNSRVLKCVKLSQNRNTSTRTVSSITEATKHFNSDPFQHCNQEWRQTKSNSSIPIEQPTQLSQGSNFRHPKMCVLAFHALPATGSREILYTSQDSHLYGQFEGASINHYSWLPSNRWHISLLSNNHTQSTSTARWLH